MKDNSKTPKTQTMEINHREVLVMSWSAIAGAIAADAHEARHGEHWGLAHIGYDGDEGRMVFALFDNHPYMLPGSNALENKSDPTDGRRGAVLGKLKAKAEEIGVFVRAEADYPVMGEQAGYTRVLVCDGSEDSMRDLITHWEELREEDRAAHMKAA